MKFTNFFVHSDAPKVNMSEVQIQLCLNILKWHALRGNVAAQNHSVLFLLTRLIYAGKLLIGVRHKHNLSSVSKPVFKCIQLSETLFHAAYLTKNLHLPFTDVNPSATTGCTVHHDPFQLD